MTSLHRGAVRGRRALLGAGLVLSFAPPPAQTQVTELTVAGRTSANPTIAAAGAFVAVAWSSATVSSMDLFVAVSRDGGSTFSSPVQVNRVAGDARVSGENPPRVALVSRQSGPPDIVVVWTSRSGKNSTLQYARSTDAGRSFSATTPVPGSEAPGNRGWPSVAVDTAGRITVLWLDHRGLVMADSGHTHGAATSGAGATAASASMTQADPTARAGLSEVYAAQLDGASTRVIARSPCYCCKTALVADGATWYAAWRHVFPDGERDIAFSTAVGGASRFSAPSRLSADHWKLDGCPDNGPALAVDRAHGVHAVWPTVDGGGSKTDLALFYAAAPNGRQFGARSRIPTRGPAGHVQVAVSSDGTPVVAWDEVVDGIRRLGFARVRTAGGDRVVFAPVSLRESRDGDWYPALAQSSAGVFATWVRKREGGSVIGVARIP